MISVIVPVYNVESYLRKCLDSVVNQTYRDLEILIIDDGSTDGSGAICDEYAEKDDRIQVFHTENRGLSAARNIGLDEAKGEWIGFIDSDDWIEPNTVERLLWACLNNEADVSCCGIYREYAKRIETIILTKKQKTYEGNDLIISTMKGNVFEDNSWNKLWNNNLFKDFRFPVGMIFEDISTTWKLLLKCKRVVIVPDILIHHIVRKGSLGNTKTMKNLADRWIAFKERYDAMAWRSEVLRQICTKRCLDTIGYTWRWLFVVKDRDEEKICEMREFLIDNRRSMRYCSYQTRISLFCAFYSNPFTIASCFYLNQIYRRVNGFEGIY